MKWPYLLLVIIYCAGIWWLSSQSNPPRPEYTFPGDDKVVHATIYGILATLVLVGLRRSHPDLKPALLFWLPILFAAVYGLTDEIHQSFVPHRSADPLDLLADTTGALLFITAQHLFHRNRQPSAQ